MAAPFVFGVWLLTSGAGWRSVAPLFGVGATVALMQVIAPVWERRQVRSMYAQMPGAELPQVLEFTNAGVEITGGPRAVALRWEAIVEACETEEFFLLFVARNWAHYLPRRVIGGRAQEEELRGLLREKLANRARLLTVVE